MVFSRAPLPGFSGYYSLITGYDGVVIHRKYLRFEKFLIGQ
jgi:hypothetical protein